MADHKPSPEVMTKPPVAAQNSTADHLDCQTWILRVYIHCEGCKKKVLKVLHSIDGVYKVAIDSQQHKATVTGSVNGDTLVQKLLKSGKHSEVLPESFQPPAAAGGGSANSKKKKKKQKDEATTVDGVDKEELDATAVDGGDGGNEKELTEPPVADVKADGNGNGNGNVTAEGGGKKKKNKKKKGNKNENNSPPTGDTAGVTPVNTENATPSMEKLNLSPPRHQMVYATPYDLPPYQSYYPTPAYGMSYSTFYPTTESSYYTPPVYGYAQSHASGYYPPPSRPSYYPRSAFDDHDEENNGRSCTIM